MYLEVCGGTPDPLAGCGKTSIPHGESIYR
jgi:hypothetical protein